MLIQAAAISPFEGTKQFITSVVYRNALKEFWGNYNQTYIFVIQTGADAVAFTTETPSLDKIKKKVAMVAKTKQMKSEEFLDANVSKDIMMMEVNRSILENLFLVCQVSTSDLASCPLPYFLS